MLTWALPLVQVAVSPLKVIFAAGSTSKRVPLPTDAVAFPGSACTCKVLTFPVGTVPAPKVTLPADLVPLPLT